MPLSSPSPVGVQPKSLPSPKPRHTPPYRHLLHEFSVPVTINQSLAHRSIAPSSQHWEASCSLSCQIAFPASCVCNLCSDTWSESSEWPARATPPGSCPRALLHGTENSRSHSCPFTCEQVQQSAQGRASAVPWGAYSVLWAPLKLLTQPMKSSSGATSGVTGNSTDSNS